MSTLNWKKPLVVVICISLFVCLALVTNVFLSKASSKLSTPEHLSDTLNAQTPRSKPKHAARTGDISNEEIATTENTELLAEQHRSTAEVAAVDNWFKRTGFDPETATRYGRAHTKEQLRNLSMNGDTLATAALLQEFGASYPFEEMLPVAEEGIIHGSLYAISYLELAKRPPILDYEEPLEKVKAQLIDALAYQELLNMRGGASLFATDIVTEVMLDRLKKHYNYDFSMEDKILVKAKADSLYTKYEKERLAKGLGPFDNSLPEEVENFLTSK